MGAFGTWLTDRQQGGITGMCAWRWPWPGTCFCSPGGGDRVCQGQHGAHTDSQQPSSRDLPRWAQARVCYREVAAAVQALSEGPWQCHWAVAGGTSFPSVTVRAARSAARQDLVVAHTRECLLFVCTAFQGTGFGVQYLVCAISASSSSNSHPHRGPSQLTTPASRSYSLGGESVSQTSEEALVLIRKQGGTNNERAKRNR